MFHISYFQYFSPECEHEKRRETRTPHNTHSKSLLISTRNNTRGTGKSKRGSRKKNRGQIHDHRLPWIHACSPPPRHHGGDAQASIEVKQYKARKQSLQYPLGKKVELKKKNTYRPYVFKTKRPYFFWRAGGGYARSASLLRRGYKCSTVSRIKSAADLGVGRELGTQKKRLKNSLSLSVCLAQLAATKKSRWRCASSRSPSGSNLSFLF